MTPSRAQSAAAAAAGDSPRACVDRFLRVLRREGLAAALRGAWDTRVRPLYTWRRLPPSGVFTPAAAASGRPLAPHAEPVDVIVCVHNALADVRACLSSVVRHTRPPYRLVLVDDGSDEPTRDFLRGWAARQGARLVRHDAAQGYTRAANAGWRASAAPWVVLLNSDTIVAPLWLDRLVAAADGAMYRAKSTGTGRPVVTVAPAGADEHVPAA